MFTRKLRNILPFKKIFMRETKENETEEQEVHISRYKPECIDTLSRITSFSRKELQILYRGFKQECPSGLVNEETFKEIYAHFFPLGDSSSYAHFVFNAFDQDRSGTITFEEFVVGLSVLSRGSIMDKLQWTFALYDSDGDGVISRDEMTAIVLSVYELMGKFSYPSFDEVTIRDHVERIFKNLDTDRDGVISMDEFMDKCKADPSMCESLIMFDTVL